MKTNLTGDQVWVKTYGGDNMDHCFAMDISNDNSIYLSGHTLSGVQNWDSYMKIDFDGNKLWEKKEVILEDLIHCIFMMKFGILKLLLTEDVYCSWDR